jgi:hypothetical protein
MRRPTPRTAITVALLGVLAAALAACGGDGDGDDVASTTTSAPPAVAITSTGPEDLPDPTAWLLTVASLPAGFQQAEAAPPEVGPCNGPTDDARAAPARRTRTQFVGGAQVIEAVYAFRTGAEATAFIDDAVTQVRSCPSYEVETGGVRQTITHANLPTQGRGDQTFAYRVIVTAPGTDERAEGNTLYARKGPNVVTLFVGGEQVGQLGVEQLLDTALAKLP